MQRPGSTTRRGVVSNFHDTRLQLPNRPLWRQVTTPCRAACPPIDAGFRWHLEVLDTLLDESASMSQEWAFLAATLLDTLVEHFQVRRRQTNWLCAWEDCPPGLLQANHRRS